MASRYHVASKIMPLARQFAPHATLVLDTIDLHYLRESRAATLANDDGLKKSAARTRRAELGVIHASDMTLVVSQAERELLAVDAPGARVEVLSNVHEIAGPGLPFAQRSDLVFVGGFRHTPNVDAVQWFVEQVFPSIRAQLPGVTFHCIGAEPTATIQSLSQHEGVRILGHVPDLEPYMQGMRLSVAPLRFGAGVKGKINLSMAHGQPVVATQTAVEGMHLCDGVDVLVADEAQAFADAVVRAYRDEGLWNQLSRNGLDNVTRHFSMDAARDVVRRVFFDGTE